MQNFGEGTICHLPPTYLQNLKDISTQFYYVKLSAVKDSKVILNCPSRENSYIPTAYPFKEILWNFSKYTRKKIFLNEGRFTLCKSARYSAYLRILFYNYHCMFFKYKI